VGRAGGGSAGFIVDTLKPVVSSRIVAKRVQRNQGGYLQITIALLFIDPMIGVNQIRRGDSLPANRK
jgi:hypothetical protein